MAEFKSKLEQTRKKLLDLTKRNKLINYKRPSKTRNLKIIDESPEFIYQQLVFKETPFKFKFIPEPEILQLENNKLLEKKDKLEKVKQSTIFDGEKKAAQHQIKNISEQLQKNKSDALLTAEEQAKKLGFITSLELPDIDLETQNIDDKYTDDYLQTLHYPSDLEKILKKIELNARSIIQETGANMLYLILGILEWRESNNSEIKIKSPLINIPVTLGRGSLNRKTNTYEYLLEYNGASIDTNKSLAEKLKNDFNILLPELTEELSFNEYMTEVKKICNNKKEWKIKQEISLDFLQFSKILMYKDLDTENWNDGALENNQVLQDIFLGKEISSVSYSPEEYDIDNNKVALNAPLIMDADSSQHSAIVDVLDGKNVVIEGPPGTGKSQTISNMIASLIADGKSVLFVSEKLAALDVVSKRLASNQLGDFCLELHSHKTQKAKVLESLKTRIDGEYYSSSELERVKQELESKKIVLRKYIDILHLEHGKANKKIFEIFWLVEKYQVVEKYLKFEIIDSESFDIIGINNRIEELRKYQAYVNDYDFNTFYWNGFELNNLQFVDIEIFIDNFKNINVRYKNLTSLYSKLNIDLENEIQESNNISILLTKLEKYNIQNINQELLHQLAQNDLSVFENYLSLSLKQIKLKKENKTKIIGYDNMSKDDALFIRNLNDKILKKIENEYINKRNRYEELSFELSKYINLERYSIDNELLNQLISIDNFLYKKIEVAKIEEINLINSKLIDNLSKIERIIRDLLKQLGISKIYNIYEIGIINNGLQLLNEIDQSLYINCIDIIGTTKYKSIVKNAIKEESILKDLKDNLETFASIDNINSINIQRIEQIRTNLIDKKDSLFKIFSGVFKQAKNDYSSLLRVSIPENSDTWIEHLNSIITYLSKKEQYENNLSYYNTFQDLFQGLDTDWDKITKLNDWASTVRKEVKSNELLNIILSGNEQTKLSVSSYTIELNDSLEIFNDLIQNISELYEKRFIRKLYYHTEDINILELKDKLETINENIFNYQLVIQKYEIDNYIKIEKLLNLVKKFLDSKESYKIGKESIFSLISEIIDGSEQKYKNSDIDTLLLFLKEQQYPIVEVSRLLAEEAIISTELISVANMIKKDFKYNLLNTNEELEQLQFHINIISDVNNSYISDSLKISLLNDFFNIYEILKNIKNESELASAQMKELMKYGEFKSNLFYNKQIFKYIDLSNKLNSVDNNIDNLSIWLDYKNLLAKIKRLGLIKIIEAIESDVLPKELIIEAYYYNFYNSLARTIFKKYPNLNGFSRLSHEEIIKTFKELDLKLLELNKLFVAAKASDREMPDSQSGGLVSSFTNMRLIEHEISKKKRHIPIRQLIERAGIAIKALKPCFMMSPLSVAQYLPPNTLKFDVLLVDEASQLRPEEALGIIARANQVVIVGDPKQLPPTSFFDTLKDENEDEEDTILDVSESILDSCIDLYSPVRRLKWHYRSQHETLIDFSNQQFYDNDLVVFPSPTSVSSNELGVKHTYIENAIYQGGAGKRYNKLEAKIVVEHIEKQIKEFPKKSLGIGTFNTSQRDLIQQMIDEKEKTNPLIANYIASWKDSSEPFFIKNLESLQGDERDVIYISTTYGPDKNTGRVMQRFGPINQDSGWRRLNVLVTRSKQKMHIFTSMQSSEILINENSSKGIIALKSFINFLETGILFNKPELINGKGFDSPFEESVYQLLSDAGIKTVPQVGVAGYFIDLAVVSEEGEDYILAIECDGATYHSSKSARDRDRLKDEVLNKLGWKVYRIWSVDWYKNRQNEISKLLKTIRKQQELYSERYKHRTIFTPASQSVEIIISENSNDAIGNVSKEIEEDHKQKEHLEETFQKSKYTQVFSSDERIKELLIELREKEISKDFNIDRRCILSPIMLNQFLKYKPLDMDEFRSKISLKLRTNIDREQLIFMNKIFEILEMSDE